MMRTLTLENLFELNEQMLTRMMTDNLDKVGENKEGEVIVKSFNNSVLRMLENCDHTDMFVILFRLLLKYKDSLKLPKMPGLIIKCLLKLNKLMQQIITKLDLSRMLLTMHEFLIELNMESKTHNEDMCIRIIKSVINEMVTHYKGDIWQDYEVVQKHRAGDHHLYNWI